MIMFSLRPRRSSFAPRGFATSVRTHVVSWNEAAEMNDWVVRLAFVMPSSSGSDVAGDFFFFFARSLTSRKTLLVHVLALEELRLARLENAGPSGASGERSRRCACR